MNTGDLITLLENGGAIIAFAVLLVTEVVVPRGRLEDVKAERNEMKAERDEWKHAAELNGARADAGVLAGQAASDIFRALHEVAGEQKVKELE